ncbi:MAG: ABC transporter permease [Anaerolineales bacterium]|nr:ABC transporter permease [Anaerolineales bacterium]
MTTRRVLRNRSAMIGLAIVLVTIVCAILAPVLAPYDPIKMYPKDRLSGPSSQHILGTDLYGRDMLSRILFGARLSIRVGAFSVVVGALLGTIMGLVAGYYGGVIDEAVMRLVDVLLAFPGLMLALVIVAFLGTGLNNVIIAVGIGLVPSFARLIRGCVLSAKQELYVLAAEVIGCQARQIVLRHILPNIAAPLLVLATLSVAWSILNAAALSFLGLGAAPPTPEWGTILSEGRDYLRVAPWITTFPGLAIMWLVVGVNLMGDGLRVALDPRMKL